MKRIIALLLVICLCLSMAACSLLNGAEEPTETTAAKPTHPKYQDLPNLGGGDSGCQADGGPQE